MLIHIVGDVGSGKTLLLTHFASKQDRLVYANYKINIPNYRELKPETLYQMRHQTLYDGKKQIRNYFVGLDEAYTWLDNRLSGRGINIYMGYIIFQSRKRGIDMYLTDQLDDIVDKRYRKMINVRIECEEIRGGFHYTMQKFSRTKAFKPKGFTLTTENAEKIYPLYESWEPVDSIDKNMLFNITEDKTEMFKQIKKIVAELLKKAEPEDFTLGICENICMKREYPSKWAKIIYHEIRASKLDI